MKVAVFGAGYVGLVTGACLAELGHDVVVRDVVSDKIDALEAGEVPIHEAGLADLLERNRDRLSFTMEVDEALEGAEVVYVCVGTPPTRSGDADLTAVWTVVDELPHVDRRIVLAMKSTVPVGTGRTVRHRLDERGLENVGYVSNPEFTAEGTAIHDFMHPDRIVIGAFDDADADVVEALHAGIDAPVVRSDVASAEMIKLAANAALVTRISFINEIANVCEATGADVLTVAEGIGLDHRIGPAFLRAGIGYGGSCLVGEETVLVRDGSGSRLRTLEALYDETDPGERVEILTWRPSGAGPEFLPIELLTRREYEGEIVEIRTKMGRRVRCTPDHPFVTQDGRKLAEDLTETDWVPIAQGSAAGATRYPRRLRVIEAFEHMKLPPQRVFVRPHEAELASAHVGEIRAAVATLDHPRPARRAREILRSGSLRLDEATALDVELDDALLGTTTSGRYVPTTISVDNAFLRVVGLYIAEGHCIFDEERPYFVLQWCFHPTREEGLVREVAGYWERLGTKPTVYQAPTTTIVRVSSRMLVTWWVMELGLGRNCYGQRLPDLIWNEPAEHKRALLAGLWLGDGSWSFVNRGPSVVLKYGTVSRELADGVLRLLGELGITARLRVGRTAKSTVDTYWLVVSGADQVERLLDLVQERDRSLIIDSIGMTKRIAPTGYRRRDNASWVRVVDVVRRPFSGYVYSLEVSPTHTFVTTGGLVLSNCFPKDSLALKQLAANSGYSFQLLNAVIEVNELQKRRVIKKLERRLGSLRGKKIALLGLAFKPGTDDMREAPSIVLAGRLQAEGAEVSAWDPVADGKVHLDGVHVAASALDALEGADAAVLVTEWPELRELDWAEAGRRMSNRLLVDGRNMLDPATMRRHGFEYEGIGRASE